MRSRRMVLCSVALLAVAVGLAAPPLLSSAAAALMVRGPVFIWTDGGSGHAWNVVANWDFGVGYPSSTAHGAVFPSVDLSPWAVDLTTETIGQLTIEGNVDFDTAGGTPTLDIQRLVIVGDTNADTVITIAGGAKITITNP